MKTRGSLVVGIGLLAVIAVGVAVAHTHTFPTTFTSAVVSDSSSPHRLDVKGQIDSPKSSCLKNRDVQLLLDATVVSKLGDGETNTNGKFSFEAIQRGSPSQWVVKVLKGRLPSRASHHHKCGAKAVHPDIG